MAASSSHHLLSSYTPTAAPPPTPSSQATSTSSACSDTAADTLSRLLHRLPPNLSLPTRFSPRTAAKPNAQTTATPLPNLPDLSAESLSSALDVGFFQLAADSHSIGPQLAESAESEALSLLNLSRDKKLEYFPTEWPLGMDDNEEEEDIGDESMSFCLDSACSTTTETGKLKLVNLRHLSEKLEKVGMEVMESLASAVGFENPFGKWGKVGSGQISLMWVSDGDKVGRVYPYVVGLQYQIRARKYSLLSDSDAVVVEPDVGSVLVTFGDIAQVWSNGKVKKVRGRATPINSEEKISKNTHCISMTLLLSLPLFETTVSPLKNRHPTKDEFGDEDEYEMKFRPFSFEDYAWRVYHERLLLKDPLHRYRVKHDSF